MKKKNWKRIMVAMRDLEGSSRGLLAKAGEIAKRFGAALEVVHIVSVPSVQTIDNWAVSTAVIEAATERQRQQLEKLLAPLRRAGLAAHSKIIGGYPTVEGILNEVARRKPDALIVKTERRSRAGRLFLTNTDWELIRHCPCPVWLVKSSKSPRALAALAAVDPFHTHDKPARLDREILDLAQQLAGTGGRLGVCHASAAPATVVAALEETAVVPPTPEEVRRHRVRANRALDRLIGARRIARKNRFVLEQEPAAALIHCARTWKADVLVMGAVSRSALKRLFVGNTAERVLDEVSCDVVVVKPGR